MLQDSIEILFDLFTEILNDKKIICPQLIYFLPNICIDKMVSNFRFSQAIWLK